MFLLDAAAPYPGGYDYVGLTIMSVIRLLPLLIPLALTVVVTVLLIRRSRKSKAARKDVPPTDGAKDAADDPTGETK